MAFLIIAAIILWLIFKNHSNKNAANPQKTTASSKKSDVRPQEEVLTQEEEALSPRDKYNLGLQYYEGYDRGGVIVKDYKKAVTLWKRAANQGHEEAQYRLGLMYETGNGVRKNEEEAVKWYNKAAERGHVEARDRAINFNQYQEAEYTPGRQYSEGCKYYYGNGVEQSYEKAMEWYLKAANRGNAEAQYAIGEMCYYGKGVVQDNKAAEEWIRLAANHGNYYAQVFLSEKYGVNNRSKTNNSYMGNSTKSTAVNKQQTNITNNIANNVLQDKYIKAQNSKLLFDQAIELKRKGQYTAALMLYKQAYNAFPDDPDLQSTMYAMAKIYLLLGDYEKACTLFQDGLTQKLAQHDERTAKFYKKYLESQYYGGMSETDPDYIWFNDLTADYSIFIGLTHLMLENNGAALLIEYKTDFDNHIKSVAGKKAAQPSWSYLKTCHNYGWSRVLAIASESYNRCFDKIDLGYVQKRKQEFLDILETI